MNNKNSYPVRQPRIRRSLLIKYAIALLLAACLSPVAMAQPNITRVEYYVDSDPGYNNATPVSIVPGKDLDGISFNISLNPLNPGVHIVGIRSKDANGAWSIDNKWLFLKPYPKPANPAQPNIMRVEYYIDADPGYGNGTALSIVAGKDLTGLAINIDLATVSSGVHIVGVRSLDANGAWSLDNRWLFIKPYPNNGAITLPKVDRVEYFIDNDPGYGNATALSIVPNTNFNNLSFDINLNTVASGVHVVGVRSRDENGAWSLDNRWLFVKPYPAGKSLNQPKIGRIEYYIDADPGYGNGIPLSFNSTNNISASFSINLAPLSQGVHIVGVRSLDSLGAWGLDNRWVFLKPYSAGVALPQPNITQVEYWVDGDPGYGHATQVSVVAAKDIANLSFPVDISNLSVGVQHKIGVRSRDANGAWSLDNLWAITIVSHAGLLNSIGDATSLKQEASTNSLRLQYNPVHQQAVVLYTSTKEDKTTIRVIDNLGRVVQTKEAKLFAGVNIITLETGVLANGVYTVQAAGPKQNLSVRMMKQ